MTLRDRLRRLLRGHGPSSELLSGAADVGLRITPDGPESIPDVPAFCASSAHRAIVELATIPGWKAGVALLVATCGRSSPRTAYCLRCAALAYVGGAFRPDGSFLDEVREEVDRLPFRSERP